MNESSPVQQDVPLARIDTHAYTNGLGEEAATNMEHEEYQKLVTNMDDIMQLLDANNESKVTRLQLLLSRLHCILGKAEARGSTGTRNERTARSESELHFKVICFHKCTTGNLIRLYIVLHSHML